MVLREGESGWGSDGEVGEEGGQGGVEGDWLDPGLEVLLDYSAAEHLG